MYGIHSHVNAAAFRVSSILGDLTYLNFYVLLKNIMIRLTYLSPNELFTFGK